MNLSAKLGGRRGPLVGSLSAHIPGDWRYGDDLAVFLNESGQVVIEVSVTGAVGGMDTFNGATDPSVSFRAVLSADSTPAQVVAAIKRAMTARPEFVLKRYGKPSKNFRWGSRPHHGFNARLAGAALAEARDELAEARRRAAQGATALRAKLLPGSWAEQFVEILACREGTFSAVSARDGYLFFSIRDGAWTGSVISFAKKALSDANLGFLEPELAGVG